MTVRAMVTGTDGIPQGDNVRLTWTHIFYGTSVPGGTDSGPGAVIVTPAMTAVDVKTAIKTAIQADATRLGYGVLQRAPQHVDEVFHNL